MGNIRRALRGNGIQGKVKSYAHRIIIETRDVKKTSGLLRYIFGLVSFSPSVSCNKDIKEMEEVCLELAKKFKQNDTFGIICRRSDKTFMTSQEIKERIGNSITNLGFKVNLSEPERRIFIEVRDRCYIYTDIINGPGGLPVGSVGRLAGLSDNDEHLLANWLLMKRGVELVLLGEENEAYTTLAKWSLGRKLRMFSKDVNLEKIIHIFKIKGVVEKRPFGPLLNLWPLDGFSDKEKKELLRRIKRINFS
jgi:adenylyl- and sulfurtransferase ThiI